MESTMCWGISSLFPKREKKACFSGFQNPRMPSYFSNSHLRGAKVKKMMSKIAIASSLTILLDLFALRSKNKLSWVLLHPQCAASSIDQGSAEECQAVLGQLRLWRSVVCQGVLVGSLPANYIARTENCKWLSTGMRIRYLSLLPSHQHGTRMSVMPFSFAKRSFISSRAL